MVADIAPQQQLPEVFSTNRNHHCSHKRNSNSNTMTNGQRYVADDLGKKADQILGHAPVMVDYRRQPSIDLTHQHPPRLHIPVSKPRVSPVQKDRHSVTVEQLIPLISKLVAPLTYTKFPERIPRHSKHETNLNLSDDDDVENDVVDNENQNEIQHSNSDTENEDELNRTNPHTLSLMDFLPGKHSPIAQRKRSLSPPTSLKPIKRKEELIKSLSSSVNIPIDLKQPTLPITIPTYLFFEDESVKSSKRYANGSIKHETNSDTNEIPTQHKKSKTSHVYKSEPNISSMNIKEEPMMAFSNDVPSVTVTPMFVQPKKEKPTANVKPLLQSTLMDNSSSTNTNPNVVNPPDRLTTTTIHHSSRTNYANLRNMSTKELNSLAREKKKQADGEKRTFEDVKQSMSLYLESVCYFIQCANDEPIVEQRSSLLTATLNMLQHLVYNYQKMFHIPINQSAELLNNIRQKFHLIK
jgi:hypothetical protein